MSRRKTVQLDSLDKMKILSLTMLVLLPLLAFSQTSTKGRISGRVIDSETGEGVLGANVFLEGTTTGAASDLDGRFSIPIDPGTYNIVVSVVGFKRSILPNVQVVPGKVVEVSIVIDPAVIETDEVVIEAKAKTGYEGALLAQRRQAGSVSDAISAEQIKRTPDATSGDALRRLVGITLVDNKFIFVRGVTDRYNQTTLNGTPVSSTETDRRGFSFDMLPSNLLENAVVVKSATPELPGDFTGGLVQLNTLDFPDRFTLKLSVGTGYNSITKGKNYHSSQPGKTDWLGFDDGSRSLPPFSSDLTSLARTLPNNWAPTLRSVPMNTTFSLAIGSDVSFSREEQSVAPFGFITGLSYKTNFQRNPKTQDDKVGRYNVGAEDNFSVLWGALLNLSFKPSPYHKLSFRNNFNQSGSDKVTTYESTDLNTDLENRYTILQWNQRKTYSGQLTGEHSITELFGLKLDWRASVASSAGETPDRKEITYYRGLNTTDPFNVAINQRSWAKINDRTVAGALDVTVPVFGAKIKAGIAGENQKTEYRIRFFNVVPDYFGGISNSLTEAPIDQIYSATNFGPGKFLFQESSKASDSYEGQRGLLAFYLLGDVPFTVRSEKFRFVGGVRMERSRQIVDVPKTFLPNGPLETTTIEGTEWLPSANLTYHLNSITNLRLAYSKSLNRPEFREVASTGFYDFVKYELVKGNPNLSYASANNFDVRAELFPGAGEIVAVSYFNKEIKNAIEEKLEQGAVRTRSWFNSLKAVNSGWEVELRKSLDFVVDYLSQSSLTLNYTRVFSQVLFDQIEGNSAQTTVLRGKRPMQGQSPYVVNVSLLFVEPTTGTSLNILYNRFGKRLDAVGFLADDIFEESRALIDLSIAQPISSGYEAKLSVKNLTNQDRILTRGSGVYDRTAFGTSYSLALSKTF